MTAQEKKKVQRCNDLFNKELGYNQFQWKRGVELEISMQLLDPDTGVPKYDTRANSKTGLIEVVNVYVRRKMLDEKYWHSWVVCQLLLPEMDEDHYNAVWKGKLEYPRNGTWTPIQDSTLKEGILPDLAMTEFNIAAIKAFRAEFDAHIDAVLERKKLSDAVATANKIDYVRDKLPAFGQLPGKKSHTSFPSVIQPAQDCAIEV